MTPLTGHRVVEIAAESVTLEAGSRTTEQMPARTVVWAAGVVASELAGLLAAERAPTSTGEAASPSGPT